MNLKMMDVYERAAKRLERGFCTGAYATNSRGYPVHIASTEAVRWCVAGAVAVEGGSILRLQVVADNYCGTTASVLNDAYGKDAALHLLAIAQQLAAEETPL